MARISGMILGLTLLAALSSLVSPAAAWDSDDDDDSKRRRRPHHLHGQPIIVAPAIRQPVLVPPRYDHRHDLYDYDHGRFDHGPSLPYPPAPEYPSIPQYEPARQVPLAPPPLPPEQLFGDIPQAPVNGPRFASSLPQPIVAPECSAGEFVAFEAALYPHVRVKGRDEIPRHAVPQIVAVRSPDPFRFPGLVYVEVYTPPGRPGKVKVEDGGAKIEMKYNDFEVKIESKKGIISVEYDD